MRATSIRYKPAAPHHRAPRLALVCPHCRRHAPILVHNTPLPDGSTFSGCLPCKRQAYEAILARMADGNRAEEGSERA